MSTYELLDLMLSLSNRIDTHWTLFISVHLALIGGIIYVDRPLSTKEKMVAGIIYTGFAVINYLVMKAQINFLASVYRQINSMKDQLCCVDNYVIDHVVSLYMSDLTDNTQLSIIFTHLVMYIIVSLSILYDKPLTKTVPDNQED